LRVERVNECTTKITDAGKVVAWVMNVAPLANHAKAWVARYRDYAFAPTTYQEAVAEAKRMALGEPAKGHEVGSSSAHLNLLVAKFVTDERVEAPACEYDAHGRYIPGFWRQRASVVTSQEKLAGFKVRIAIERDGTADPRLWLARGHLPISGQQGLATCWRPNCHPEAQSLQGAHRGYEVRSLRRAKLRTHSSR
jgi:hypothetical protein